MEISLEWAPRSRIYIDFFSLASTVKTKKSVRLDIADFLLCSLLFGYFTRALPYLARLWSTGKQQTASSVNNKLSMFSTNKSNRKMVIAAATAERDESEEKKCIWIIINCRMIYRLSETARLWDFSIFHISTVSSRAMSLAGRETTSYVHNGREAIIFGTMHKGCGCVYGKKQ